MNQQFTQDFTKLTDFFLDTGDLGIVIGSHQTLDTVASSLALFLSLKASGKKIQIVSIKEPLVEVASLVGVDKIKQNFTGDTTKLVVSLPYVKGEVEKVLFTEQADTINFHLTAAQDRTITPFDLNQVKLNWEGGAPKNIITVGVGNQNELIDIIDVENSRIVNIDNYQNNSRFGEIVLVDESYSSISEIVGKIIKDERLPFDQDIAQNILDGVLFATRNFTKANTSPAAFETASYAMYQGAQRRNENNRPPMPQNDQRQAQGRDSVQRKPYDAVSPKGFDNSQNRPSASPSQRRDDRNQGRNQKVSNSDFPAMHIQDIRNQIQNDGRTSNPRQNNPAQRGYNQPRQNQNVRGGNMTNPTQNRDMSPMQDNQFDQNMPVEDAQIVDERPRQPQFDSYQDKPFDSAQGKPFDPAQGKQNMHGLQAPEAERVEDVNDENVPDDWLMPKVFKSSKNNN